MKLFTGKWKIRKDRISDNLEQKLIQSDLFNFPGIY